MIPESTFRRGLLAAASLAITAVMGTACLRLAAAPDDARLREMELGYLRAAVAPDLLGYAHLEIAAIEQVRVADEAGQRGLGLRVFAGQPLKNGGIRAEVSVDAPYRVGDTVEYRWRFLIPEDFASDAPLNRWWVLADWHDQPDRTRGETWDGFPARSAPIILGYGQVGGEDVIGLSYGSPDPAPVTTFPVRRGRWHDISVRIAWARDASGRVAVGLDGAPVAAAAGPNMHNAFQHYAKIGMYRDPQIPGDDWIYLTGLEIGPIAPGSVSARRAGSPGVVGAAPGQDWRKGLSGD
jgi:hypothetical protein